MKKLSNILSSVFPQKTNEDINKTIQLDVAITNSNLLYIKNNLNNKTSSFLKQEWINGIKTDLLNKKQGLNLTDKQVQGFNNIVKKMQTSYKGKIRGIQGVDDIKIVINGDKTNWFIMNPTEQEAGVIDTKGEFTPNQETIEKHTNKETEQ